MKDERKTKAQLINELTKLKKQIKKLEQGKSKLSKTAKKNSGGRYEAL